MEPAAKKLCTSSAKVVKRIAVEGNIAAGKSTFLRLLEETNPEFRVVSEPLTKWLNITDNDDEISTSQKYGGNLLDMFYKDQKRWAYSFQTYACISRLRAQMKSLPLQSEATDPVFFYERSVYSDRYIFAYNCHQNGMMTDTEWHMYCDWHSFLTETLPASFDGFIYLRTDPKVCFGRLQKRNRPEESSIPQEYMDSLHQRHEDWLINKTVKIPPHLENVPILTLDSSPEFETDENRRKELMKQVSDFVTKIVAVES